MVRYEVFEDESPFGGTKYLVVEMNETISVHDTKAEAEAARDRLEKQNKSGQSRRRGGGGGGAFDVSIKEPEVFF